jgi:hypothetical protein
VTEGTASPDRSAEGAGAGEAGVGASAVAPLSLAVGHVTAGRDALERHEEGEAILAYQHALPLAEAAVAAGDGPHEDLVRFLVYLHDVLCGLMLGRSHLDQAEQHYTAALVLSKERYEGSLNCASQGSSDRPGFDLVRVTLRILRR